MNVLLLGRFRFSNAVVIMGLLMALLGVQLQLPHARAHGAVSGTTVGRRELRRGGKTASEVKEGNRKSKMGMIVSDQTMGPCVNCPCCHARLFPGHETSDEAAQDEIRHDREQERDDDRLARIQEAQLNDLVYDIKC
jgi:hypothetical protein